MGVRLLTVREWSYEYEMVKQALWCWIRIGGIWIHGFNRQTDRKYNKEWSIYRVLKYLPTKYIKITNTEWFHSGKNYSFYSEKAWHTTS